jgi:antitoxin MazE
VKEDSATREFAEGSPVLREPKKKPRVGWAEAATQVAAAGDDGLVLPEMANDEDLESVW